MIEVKNLVKKYDNHLAVDHLNFSVEKGQIYGFLGPNGAGKSTTMNIMTGYLGATEGEVLINGYNILEEPEKAKRCIGYLPELPPLYMDMTVMEYLKFAAELKGIAKEKRKEAIAFVIQLTKLEEVKKRLIKNLSKGYKQRVGFAQAVLGMPEIIILDEPSVGLDPKQIIEIRDLIKELGKNHTILLSSHILSEVSAVCDYILIIAQGKLVASDTPNNLEKLFGGANTIEVSIKGAKERVEEVLNNIEEIEKIELQEKGEEVFVSIQTAKEVDIREILFYRFAEEKMPILMMKTSSVSLEDVFLELTSSEQEQQKDFNKQKKQEKQKEEKEKKEQKEKKEEKEKKEQEEQKEEEKQNKHEEVSK